MFLFRIGKEKWAYTLTMSIYKIKYTDLASLTHNHQIEIDIKRGNHELTYLSAINKRGQIVPDKQTQSISMTLYYDKDDKKFDRKEMIIKGRILDEYHDVETQLGEAELDIAQYAKQQGAQKFILQVELESNRRQVCRIKFNVTVERNLDEKKENMETTTQNLSEKEEKKSRMSVDKVKPKLKESSIKQLTSRQEEKSQKASLLSLPLHLTKPSQRFEKTLSRHLIKQPKEEIQLSRDQNELTNKEFSPKPDEFQPPSEDNDTVVLRKNTPPKLVNQTSTAYSTELKLYEAQKKLKSKQQQTERLKKMLEDQQKINLVLAEQQRKQYNYKESVKLNKELTQMRTQLQVANMKISELESSNRTYLDQIERNQLSADKMGQQIAYYKRLLEKEKLKVAELLQKALQTGDSDLIALVEETFAEE